MSILDYFFPDLRDEPALRVRLAADIPPPLQQEVLASPPAMPQPEKPREGISLVEAIQEAEENIARHEKDARQFASNELGRMVRENADRLLVEQGQAAADKFLAGVAALKGNWKKVVAAARTATVPETAAPKPEPVSVEMPPAPAEPFETPFLPPVAQTEEEAEGPVTEAAPPPLEQPPPPTPVPAPTPRAGRSVYPAPAPATQPTPSEAVPSAPPTPATPATPPAAPQAPAGPPQGPSAPPAAPPPPSQPPGPPSATPEEQALFRRLTADVRKQGPDAWRIYEETAEAEAGRAKRRSWFQNAAATANYWLATKVNNRRQKLADKADQFREMAEAYPATLKGLWWKARWRSNQAAAERWGRIQNEVENNRLQFEARANGHLNGGIHHINRALIPLQIEHADKADTRKRLEEAVKLWSRNLEEAGNEVAVMDRNMRQNYGNLERLATPVFQKRYVDLKARYKQIEKRIRGHENRMKLLDAKLQVLRDHMEPLDLLKRELANKMVHPGRTSLMATSPGYAESQPYTYPFQTERGARESDKKPGDSWTVGRFVDTWNAMNPDLPLDKEEFIQFMKEQEPSEEEGGKKRKRVKAETRITREEAYDMVQGFAGMKSMSGDAVDVAYKVFKLNAYGE